MLIIDEVSMIHAWFLTLLEAVGRELRRSDAPMGGLRVIMVGDMMQLPPVQKEKGDVPLVFEGDGWKRLNPRRVTLVTDHRQDDKEFLHVLSQVRLGSLDEAGIAYLRRHVYPTVEARQQRLADRPRASYMYGHNADVDAHNERELLQLPGETVEFRAKDDVFNGKPELLRPLQAPELLKLRVGAEIMFLVNLAPHAGWFNGARGVVLAMDEKRKTVRVRLHHNGATMNVERHEFKIEKGEVLLARRTQFPMRLAWAVTMHKSQGQTLTGDVQFGLNSDVFAYGQAYVALSRVRSADQLVLTEFRPACIRAHPRALEFEQSVKKEGF